MTLPKVKDKGRPRLWLTVAEEHAARWVKGAPAFVLHHLGGAAAESIQVDSVSSPLQANYFIHFEPVTSLATGTVEVYARLIGPAASMLSKGWARACFDLDAAGSEAVCYPVHMSFQWDGKQDEEWLNLLWETRKRRLRGVSPQVQD